MPDYQPLDLSAYCNAGPEIYPPQLSPPAGAVMLHGLPFLIGSDDGRLSTDHDLDAAPRTPQAERRMSSLLGCGEGLHSAPLSIPVGTTARTMIFAHARLESEIPQGDPVGR